MKCRPVLNEWAMVISIGTDSHNAERLFDVAELCSRNSVNVRRQIKNVP